MKSKLFITFITVLLTFSLVFLSSCGEKNREYNEQEVLTEARVLLEKSIVVN